MLLKGSGIACVLESTFHGAGDVAVLGWVKGGLLAHDRSFSVLFVGDKVIAKFVPEFHLMINNSFVTFQAIVYIDI